MARLCCCLTPLTALRKCRRALRQCAAVPGRAGPTECVWAHERCGLQLLALTHIPPFAQVIYEAYKTHYFKTSPAKTTEASLTGASVSACSTVDFAGLTSPALQRAP